MSQEFDFQWKNLPDPNLEYVSARVTELLDYTGLELDFFREKYCLDVGCGTGRWTWAMLQMHAKVDSFDISKEAIDVCKRINPNAYVFDLMNLRPTEKYDFVLCWGVLHHLPTPLEGFLKVASQVRAGGLLHVMVYHKDVQKTYEPIRRVWHTWTTEERLAYCRKRTMEIGGTIHGWWDAFNPAYNWSFTENEVEKWFENAGFKDIRLIKKHNINMIGKKSQVM